MNGSRILVLAPHPDDEVVMCAAAVGRARAAGAQVFVSHLTTGVPDGRLLWPWDRKGHADRVDRRIEEARKAAGLLGLQVVGLAAVPSRELRRNLTATRVRVRRTIEEHGIDTLWVPAFEGGHQDHDAANCLAATLADQVTVVEFAAYNLSEGKPRTQEFIAPNGTEEVLLLSPSEQAVKKQALALYVSERSNLALAAVRVEARRPLPVYDYGRPPHEGPLWFSRFHWVPFRHPRVDFTPPANVYADLAAFLAETVP